MTSPTEQPRQDFTALHNVRLVNVTADDDGNELLHVEGECGERWALLGTGKVSDWRKKEIGQVGVVRRADQGFAAVPSCACHFHKYPDQSLRRAPELDLMELNEPSIEGRKQNVIGWRCDARGGFRAPIGLTPGEGGQFIEDRSVSVTLRVPHEFVEECKRYGMTPAEMLQGFACDAAGITNYVVNPRADGFGSNGSDERDMADAWMQRAYFARLEEADRLEEERERAEERVAEIEDLGWLLQDWLTAGGDKAALDAFLDEHLEAARRLTRTNEGHSPDVRGQAGTSDGP